MEFSLETPGSPHFTPSDGNQDTFKRDKRRDLAARTKTVESKNKRKKRKRGGKASATSNSLELQVDRVAPKD